MLTLHRLRDLVGDDPEPAAVRNFSIRGTDFDFAAQRYVMGVVNLSADSWYRESVCLSVDHAIRRGRQLHLAGAALVDVGAESTLPQAALVDARDQVSMLRPTLDGLVAAGVPVSVETYHPEVADAVLRAGASVINLTGRQGGREVYRAVAKHEAGVIICYVAGDNVRQVQDLPDQNEIIDLQLDYFRREVEVAMTSGVERIFIDPGLGFYYRNSTDGRTRVTYQRQVFLHTYRLRQLGWPVCHALPHAFHLFREEVRSAEGFFAVMAALGGTSLLRTHEVARVVPVLDALSLA
jgi:dihydropteroate synthase